MRIAIVASLMTAIAAGLILFQASRHHRSEIRQSASDETASASDTTLVFNLSDAQSKDEATEWVGTYAAQGKVARFRIRFGQTHKLPRESSDEPIVESGRGAFVAEPRSDASVMLGDLQKALGAKTFPDKRERLASVPFTFVIIGKNLSLSKDGGFGSEPPGGWMAIKIFVGSGSDEGQFFLGLNPVGHLGEFSMKDPDYGDLVLAKLVKVL